MASEEMIEQQNAYYIAGYPSRRSENRTDKDELKKEAEEYSKKICGYARVELVQAYLALEDTNKKISDECHKLVDSLEKKQNENIELIGKVAFLENDLNNAKAQIEKMKNWCNCKNYQQCLIELAEQGKGMKPKECCVNCKKWELEDYKTRLARKNNKEIKENE